MLDSRPRGYVYQEPSRHIALSCFLGREITSNIEESNNKQVGRDGSAMQGLAL